MSFHQHKIVGKYLWSTCCKSEHSINDRYHHGMSGKYAGIPVVQFHTPWYISYHFSPVDEVWHFLSRRHHLDTLPCSCQSYTTPLKYLTTNSLPLKYENIYMYVILCIFYFYINIYNLKLFFYVNDWSL